MPSILDVGPSILLTSGRMGIALALQHLGVEVGDEVLVSAYHCSSMVEPVHWTGAKAVFYRIRPDMSADLGDMRAKVGPRTRALLATHFFGFPQDTPSLRRFCDEHDIVLIEDCAHAFFGSFFGHPPGWMADYAIASSMKFFPAFDGGCLVSHRRELSAIKTVPASMTLQIKSMTRTVESAFAYGRLRTLAPLFRALFAIKDGLWRLLKGRFPPGAIETEPAASSGGAKFEPHWMHKRMSTASRLIMQNVSTEKIVAGRIRHFQRMLEELHDVPGARPLFSELPKGVVPYVFPLVIDDPEQVFPILKRRGLPIFRWEVLDPSAGAETCPVSWQYSRALLQFPCHECYLEEEMQWMLREIRDTLSHRQYSGVHR